MNILELKRWWDLMYLVLLNVLRSKQIYLGLRGTLLLHHHLLLLGDLGGMSLFKLLLLGSLLMNYYLQILDWVSQFQARVREDQKLEVLLLVNPLLL